MKSLVMRRLAQFFNKVIFRNAAIGIISGMVITAIVQSSSVTTSLIVPLAGAGLVTLEQVFPFTLGANVGTTVTALMASMVTQNPSAVAVAFTHLLFNIFGICVFLPARFIPVFFAKQLGMLAIRNRAYPILFIILMFLIVPLLLIKLVG
jgi:sodium-dependent phosphate cotransporter